MRGTLLVFFRSVLAFLAFLIARPETEAGHSDGISVLIFRGCCKPQQPLFIIAYSFFQCTADSYSGCSINGISDLRQTCKSPLQLLIGGDMIGHFAVIEFLICYHIKISRACQTEKNGFFLACLLAP